MKVIEFFGMPKAGKTTALEVVESYFKSKKARIRTVYEGARVCPLDKSDRFHYNAWSFHNTMNRVLEARLNHYDYVLVDRGVIDHLAFTEAIGPIRGTYEYIATKDYYRQFLDLQDQEIYFTIDIDEALRREAKHNPFTGRVMEREFLMHLAKSYEVVIKEDATRKGRKIETLDGNLPMKENIRRVLSWCESLEN